MNPLLQKLVCGLASASLFLSLGLAALADLTLPPSEYPSATSNSSDFQFVPLLNYQEKPQGSALLKHTPRVVLALGGGGMRGAAHVGVLKVLVKEGIPIDGIAGTSMGSVVGGLYAAGMPLSEIETRFVNGSMMKSFTPIPVLARLMLVPITSSPRLIGFHPYEGLYAGNAFKHYLQKAVPKDKTTIESLNIPFVAVAIDLCDGHVYSIQKGNLVNAMRASSAVPGLRKPIPIDDKLFVDGGYLANLPVPHARALGGDVVIAVQIDEPFKVETQNDFRKLGSVEERMFNLQLSAFDAVHARKADILIHPSLDRIGLVSTKISDAKRAIAAGEAAAEEALPAIKEKLQAFGIATKPGTI